MADQIEDEDIQEEIVENDDDGFIELEDGSTLIPDTENSVPTGEFDDNLALVLVDSKLQSIAHELCDLIEEDIRSRAERDKQYEEGIQRTGLGNDAPGGTTFEGASRVVHPVLAEACVDYASATIKEIFPPDGPVKMHYLSVDSSPESIEKAENKRDFLNWQLTNQIVEYRSELEVLLTQQPLGGSQFLKFWYDETKRRIRCEFVPVDKLYLPFSANSFLVTERFTISDDITDYELKRRIDSGLYRDVDLKSTSIFPEESSSEEATNRVEGKEQDSFNSDGLREIYEVHVYYDVEDKGPLPYIITIDRDTEIILSIYRNWEESDVLQQRTEWVVEFPFIPWRGAYGIGLLHLIGGLSAAATGALRALLDSALINNFPGSVKLKGGKTSGQNLTIGPMEVVELDAPANVDDIRKLLMSVPFNPPSPVLFQLLGWLTDAAKGVVATAEEKISDASNTMPVGTAMALIEQGSKVFSAIHARQHMAQQRSLSIIQRLNGKYYDEEVQVLKFGKVLVTQEDFLNTGNVIPVSDPNIFSESQRFAQVQSILQMSQDQSVQWDKHAIYMRILRLMHVNAPQEFLTPLPQPVSADPVTEIVAAMSGQQLLAKPDMDHMHHIREQLSYLLDPLFGAANPSLMNPGFQVIMNDTFQHLIFMFQQLKMQAQQIAQQRISSQLVESIQQQGIGIPSEQIQEIIQQQLQSPQAQQAVMQAANQIFSQMQQQMMPLTQQIQQANELVKSKVPPQQDPQTQAMIQVAQMQEQTKMQLGQLKSQLEQAALQMRAQNEQAKIELEKIVKLSLTPQRDQAKMETEVAKNDADNKQHQITELLKNRDDNKTNLEIAGLREQGATERKADELYQKATVDILTTQMNNKANEDKGASE